MTCQTSANSRPRTVQRQKPLAFPVAQAKRSGDTLKFIVPIEDGKIDDDALEFDLAIDGKTLKGHGREMRKGADKLPITFAKQE